MGAFVNPPVSSSPTAQPQRISDILRHLIDTSPEARVSIGHILHTFGVRGFAFLLFTLALLNIVIFMVPFTSVLFGIPMVVLATQMVLGVHTPIFPFFIRRQTISREALVDGINRAIHWVGKMEKYIKPRFTFLTHPRLDRVHGLVAMILAMMVALPIPVFNVPPSVALVLLGIGMLQRDGIFVIAAYSIGFWCLYLFRSLGYIAHSLT